MLTFLLLFVTLILCVLVIVLTVRVATLAGKVDGLDQKLNQVTTPPLEKLAPGTARMESQTMAGPAPPPGSPPSRASVKPASAVTQAAAERVPPVPEAAARPSRSRAEWEALIGGKLLNRIGALALIIGVGFFLKYAFDNEWVTETFRVVIGGVIGLVLLLGARGSRRRGFVVFAQGLVGAGIAILYLSVYASFNFYNLISQPAAFALMAIVTAVTFTQAFSYDSLVVALLGWFGGFLTPIMLSTGEPNEIGLFTYIAVLDAGLLLIILRKDVWAVLEPLTMLATYGVFLLWKVQHYSSDAFTLTLFFLMLFWALFVILDVWRIVRGISVFAELRRLLAVLNILIFYPTFHTLVNPLHHDWMGAATLAVGAVYVLGALIIKQKQPHSGASYVLYIIVGIILLVVATGIQFEGFTTVQVWAVEALAIAWLGTTKKMRPVWISALVLFGFAVVKLVATAGALHMPARDFTIFLNARAVTFFVLAATVGLSVLLFRGLEDPVRKKVQQGLHYGWCILGFALLTVETRDYYSWVMEFLRAEPRSAVAFTQQMSLAAVWMVYSLPLVWFGLRKEIAPLLLSGVGTLSIAVGLGAAWGLAYVPIERFSVVINIRSMMLILLIAGTVLHTLWLVSSRRRYHRLEAVLHFTWGLLVLELLTVETNDYFRRLANLAAEETIPSLMFARMMTLAAVWMVYSLPMVRLGLGRKIQPTLYLGLLGLLLSFGLAVIRGIAYEPVEKFSVLLNYRAYIIGIVLAGGCVQLWWLRYSGQMFGVLYGVPQGLRMAIVILGLVLLTGETHDFFQKQLFFASVASGTAAGDAEIQRLENLKQLSLSSLWLLYSIALMAIGLWRRERSLRIAAIVLFGIAILKIFIYDLSYLDTLYRIFSFVGLGVILLAASYLYQRYKSIILESSGPPEKKGVDSVSL